MKYELSFLNNIHDSMEMVNVELLKIYLKKLKKIFEIQ